MSYWKILTDPQLSSTQRKQSDCRPSAQSQPRDCGKGRNKENRGSKQTGNKGPKNKEATAPVIHNLVAHCRLVSGSSLDLVGLAQKLDNCQLNSRRFPALVFRQHTLGTSALLFHNGRMLVTGACSQQQALRSVMRVVEQVQGVLRQGCQVDSFRVTNIVAQADLGFEVQVRSLRQLGFVKPAYRFAGMASLGFPGIKSVVLFSTGKVVFSGAQRPQAITQAFRQLLEQIPEHLRRPRLEQ